MRRYQEQLLYDNYPLKSVVAYFWHAKGTCLKEAAEFRLISYDARYVALFRVQRIEARLC